MDTAGSNHDAALQLEASLRKLQISEELEKALQSEFIDIKNDPLLSSNLDISEYINQRFKDEASLEDLEDIILQYESQIQDIDTEIKTSIREHAFASENCREELDKINEESFQLVAKITNVREKAEKSEEMVQSISTEIRNLDVAKKNIVFSITSLKRMLMLITGIEQLREFCRKK